MAQMSSKQQQLEEFAVSSLLPKVEEAVRAALRTKLTTHSTYAITLGKNARLNVTISLEGEFDLRNLKLGDEVKRDASHLN